MSEKARQFRSLLLEPLECRSVFSADGLDVWQFSQSSLRFEFDQFQPAQYPHAEAESLGNDMRKGDNLGHKNDFGGVKYYQGRSPHGSIKLGSSMNRDRFDDVPLPPGESEDTSARTPSTTSDTKTSLDSKIDLKPNLDVTTVQPPPPSGAIRILILGSSATVGLPQSHTTPLASGPTRTQFDLPGTARVDSLPTGNSTANISPGRVQPSLSQNPTSPFPTALNSSTPLSSTTSQTNLLSANAVSTIASGTTTFDLSSQVSNGVEQADSLSKAWGDDFRFTRPIPAPSGAIVDQALVERASSLKSLENLLSGLAESHRRNRTQNGFDVNQPSSSDDPSRRPESSTSVEVMFADGGMIALALNRDIAMSELEKLSEDARSENKAWIANVGIFRAFENGAVAATEYAGLNNRVTRNAVSSSSPQEVAEVEGEVANTRFHPLLASTSAALGVVMLGLRRMRRKNAPLLLTSRKR